jgi:hypothetical protein
MWNEIEDNEGYLHKVMFMDKVTFHFKTCVNLYNCKIWESPQLDKFFWVCMSYSKGDCVVGPFFFVERTITGDICLYLLEQFVSPSNQTTFK